MSCLVREEFPQLKNISKNWPKNTSNQNSTSKKTKIHVKPQNPKNNIEKSK